MTNGITMNERSRSLPWVLVVCLLPIYLLLFPFDTRQELLVGRDWSIDLARQPSPTTARNSDARNSDEAPIGFLLGDRFGYVDSSGSLRWFQERGYGVALNDQHFIVYSQVTRTQILQDSDGRVVGGFESAGYPLLFDDRLLIMEATGDALSEWSHSGERLWLREFAAVIGGVAVGGDVVALGLIDGRIETIDRDGKSLSLAGRDGGRIRTTVGVAVNGSGTEVAAVVDIDPQRLVSFDLSGADPLPRLDIELAEDYRRPVLLQFLGSDCYLAVEQPGGMMIASLSSADTSFLAFQGIAHSIADGADLVAIPIDTPLPTLLLVALPDRIVARIDLSGLTNEYPRSTSLFAEWRDRRLLIGVGDTLMMVRIEYG